jgi:hypothetical protein
MNEDRTEEREGRGRRRGIGKEERKNREEEEWMGGNRREEYSIR